MLWLVGYAICRHSKGANRWLIKPRCGRECILLTGISTRSPSSKILFACWTIPAFQKMPSGSPHCQDQITCLLGSLRTFAPGPRSAKVPCLIGPSLHPIDVPECGDPNYIYFASPSKATLSKVLERCDIVSRCLILGTGLHDNEEDIGIGVEGWRQLLISFDERTRSCLIKMS